MFPIIGNGAGIVSSTHRDLVFGVREIHLLRVAATDAVAWDGHPDRHAERRWFQPKSARVPKGRRRR